MKIIHKIFAVGYTSITVLFFGCGLALIVFAVLELWHGVNPSADLAVRERFNAILESIGLLTIAIAALELGQTILEEEVLREAHMSAPTRVRRFLSRFMVVIVVSLSVEALIAIFQFVHDDPTQLPQAAMVGVAAGVLLAAWGLFVKLNRSAEEIQPEALKDVKEEERKVEEL